MEMMVLISCAIIGTMVVKTVKLIKKGWKL